MRRIFYISPLLLTLAACSSDGDQDTYIVDSDMLINLDVASITPTEKTRAVVKGVGEGPWADDDQFVVNALYYNSATTTLGQQFFQNQLVTATITNSTWNNSSTTKWDYTPLKYWPQQGYVDFFAAYPQDYVDNNMDRQRLFHENIADTVISTRFYLDKPIPKEFTGRCIVDGEYTNYSQDEPCPGIPLYKYSDAEQQWDLMFSHRPHLSKPDVTMPVKFHFSHAEMAVRFFTKGLGVTNVGGLTIKQISLNNIHTGGKITATDATDWQKYYAEYPGSPGVEVSTAGAKTPVKLDYDWDWTGIDPLAPDIRDTYTQTMDFLWFNGSPTTVGTQINPGDKVFIIPPQCLGEDSGSSITVDYLVTDLGPKTTYHSATFNVDICGEPGKILNIYLTLNYNSESHVYEIEPITATLIPWEDINATLSTDLEQ